MDKWYDIRGIIGSLFGIGNTNLKDNSGVIEARNSDDSGFAVVRAADPLADNDVVNKKTLESAVAGASGVVRTIRFAVATSSTSSTTQIPANAQILEASITMVSAYDTGTTIDIGQSGDTDLLIPNNKNKPTKADTSWTVPYPTGQDWGASDESVLATVSGSPTSGSAVVLVKYCVPNN